MKKYSWSLMIVCFLACAAAPARSDPGPGAKDDSLAQVQLIMSRIELEIFAHLADDTARVEFITDFWKKRDPSPASEENEFKEDFAKRVEFANRWFHERGPTASGWDSERGHILLMLGFPDQRDQMPMLDNPRIKAAEIWTYNNFALHLEFIDSEGFGRFRLERWPLELLDAIEQVKALGAAAGEKNYFRFKVSRDASGLRLEMPLKYLVVEERGEEVRSAFTVTVDVYCDYIKLERLDPDTRIHRAARRFHGQKKHCDRRSLYLSQSG